MIGYKMEEVRDLDIIIVFQFVFRFLLHICIQEMDRRARTIFILRAVVNAVMKLRVPSNGGELLDSL